MLKTGVQISLFVVAISVTFPMTAFSETSRSTENTTPSGAQNATNDIPKLVSNSNVTYESFVNTDSRDNSLLSASVEHEIQNRFNELRSKLLDDRAGYINLWLSAIAIVLTFFGIVIAIAGFVGFRRFQNIEFEAKSSVESVKISEEAAKTLVEEAETLVQKIKSERNKAREIVSFLDAERVSENPAEAERTVENIQDDPKATLIEKAIAKAVSLQQQGNKKDAIEKWRAISQIAKGSDNELAARAWFSIGYLREDDFPDNKILAYDRAIQLKPEFSDAYINRGNAKQELGQPEHAIADFNKAIEIKPDFAEAYFNRGNAKLELGQLEHAIADFDKAIEIKPDYAKAYSNRGNVKLNLGQLEHAIADFDIAIQLKPDYVEAYFNRGLVKHELGQLEHAIADFDKAMELARNSGNTALIKKIEQYIDEDDTLGARRN